MSPKYHHSVPMTLGYMTTVFKRPNGVDELKELTNGRTEFRAGETYSFIFQMSENLADVNVLDIKYVKDNQLDAKVIFINKITVEQWKPQAFKTFCGEKDQALWSTVWLGLGTNC